MKRATRTESVLRTIKLQEFYDKNHSFKRKCASTDEERELLGWLRTMRCSYINGTLSEARLKLFKANGQDVYNFVTREDYASRQSRLAYELMDYMASNSKLPTFKENQTLYSWLVNSRKAFNLNSLRKDAIEILDSVNPMILRADSLKSLLVESLRDKGDDTQLLQDIVGNNPKVKRLVRELNKLDVVTIKDLVDTLHRVYSEFDRSFQSIASMDCSELHSVVASEIEAVRLISILVTVDDTETLLRLYTWICMANSKYNASFANISAYHLNAISELTGVSVLDLIVSDADMESISQRMMDCIYGLKPKTCNYVLDNKYYGKSFKEIASKFKSSVANIRITVLSVVTRFNRDIIKNFILTGDVKFCDKSVDDIVSYGYKRNTARLFRRDVGFIKRCMGKGNVSCVGV